MRSKSSRRCRWAATGLLILALLSLAGCGRGGGQAEELRLPQTPILTAGPQWAVVDEPYVRLFERPQLDAPVVGYDREGSVLVIHSQTNYLAELKGSEEHWYLLEGEVATGWVFGGHLKLFVSRDRAENAATAYER
ncbi:MAG: hypothetical protein ACOC28_05250 [Alkalispirochaetaceae bacterium]